MKTAGTKILEFWDAGCGYSYLYTEDWDFAKEFKKEFGRGASYGRGAREFGWQFRIPKRVIGILQMRFKKLKEAQAEKCL